MAIVNATDKTFQSEVASGLVLVIFGLRGVVPVR